MWIDDSDLDANRPPEEQRGWDFIKNRSARLHELENKKNQTASDREEINFIKIAMIKNANPNT